MAVNINGDGKMFQIQGGFTVQLLIGEYDYEPDMQDMRIVSSFSSAYPMFIFNMNIKPIEMIQHNLLGDQIIQLTIHLNQPTGIDIVDAFVVDLLYLSGEYDIPVSNQLIGAENDNAIQDQRLFTIRAVPVHAYQVMTYNINRIYRNVKMSDILTDMQFDIVDNIQSLSDTTTGFSLLIDENGLNDSVIEQIILPPTVFKNHCDYLLNEFGLFDGFGVVYASVGQTGDALGWSKNIDYKFMNITDRWRNAEKAFKVTHLANDTDDQSQVVGNFTSSTFDANNFTDYFIYSDITTKYVANGTFSAIGVDNYFVHKPIDKFYRIDNVTMQEYMDGVFFEAKGIEPYIPQAVEDRKRFHTNHICYNRDVDNHPQSRVNIDWDDSRIQDEYWLSSKMNKSIFNMSRISFTVDRDFPLHKFTNIGEPVDFFSQTNEYEKLNGKYILFSSDIKLRKEQGGWKSSAELTLTRPIWDMNINAE